MSSIRYLAGCLVQSVAVLLLVLSNYYMQDLFSVAVTLLLNLVFGTLLLLGSIFARYRIDPLYAQHPFNFPDDDKQAPVAQQD